MNPRMTRFPIALIALVLLSVAIGAGYWWGRSRSSAIAQSGAAAGAADAERKILYWYDPMVPQERYDKPGKSSMNMTLTPKYADEAVSTGVRIDPRVRQNLGIRTALAQVGAGAGTELRVPGTLQWDLRGERRISARVAGIVEQVYVRAPYERVRAGQPLAAVLAPEWASAVAEYRALASAGSAAAKTLRGPARARLRVLGLSDTDVGASAGGIPLIVLRAPADGVLAEIGVRAGDTVMPGQPLFRLNATDRIWLEARLPQASAGEIAPGTSVEVLVSSFPGDTFTGTVEALLPDLDPQTRTQGARIVLDNRDGRLAAGMFAEAVLRTRDSAGQPWVPSEALILTGRDARLIVADPDGSFRPVRVRTGRQTAGRTEILGGLTGGERVVVSGQFLLDSEASLSGALERLGSPATEQEQPPTAGMAGMPGMAAEPAAAAPAAARNATASPPVRNPATAPGTTAGKQLPRTVERKVLYWYDPMRPDQRFDKPGKSPYMDMMLLPKYADEGEGAPASPEPDAGEQP